MSWPTDIPPARYLAVVVWHERGDRDLEPFDQWDVQELVEAIADREEQLDLLGVTDGARRCRVMLQRLRACLGDTRGSAARTSTLAHGRRE